MTKEVEANYRETQANLRERSHFAVFRVDIRVVSLLFFVSCLFVLTFVLIGVPREVAAQDGEITGSTGITVRPAIIEDLIEPGEVITGEIDVTNDSDQSVVLYIRARNIEGLYDSGLPYLAPAGKETPYEFASWVAEDLVGTQFAPRETKAVRYRIDVPQDASPGGHFGVIFMTREPPEAQIQGARLGLQVGTVFNLRVAGDIDEDAFVGQVTTDKAVYRTGNPTVNFSVPVENRGNVLIRPQGAILITTVSGKQVANISVNESAGATFPGQVRNFATTWQPENFTIGRYQAVASIVYGNEARRTETVTTSFWVLPFNLIFGVLAVIIAAFIGGYLWLRREVQKRVRELVGNTNTMGRGQKGVEGAIPPSVAPPLPKGLVLAVAVLLAVLIFLLVLIFLFA